jgi:hypothetical protein
LVSANQITCSAAFAFGCTGWGRWFMALAVLRTQQRCCRLSGKTFSSAAQNPSAAVPTASFGGIAKPLLQIAQLPSAQLAFDSHTPSSIARKRFWPRSFTPIITTHNRSSSARSPK